MRRFSLCLLVSLLLSAVLPARTQAASSPLKLAQASTVVRLAPAQVTVARGESVDVAVEVQNVQGLYAFDISMSFDPSVVQVVDADPNAAGVQVGLGTFLSPGFFMRNVADNTAGELRIAMTQLNPSPPKDGSGALIVVRLKGIKLSSASPLALVKVQLAGTKGVAIDATLESGKVSVVQAQSGPTNTPIPTQGGGLTVDQLAATATLSAQRTQAAIALSGTPTSLPPASAIPPAIVATSTQAATQPTTLPATLPPATLPATAAAPAAAATPQPTLPSASSPAATATGSPSNSTQATAAPTVAPSGGAFSWAWLLLPAALLLVLVLSVVFKNRRGGR